MKYSRDMTGGEDMEGYPDQGEPMDVNDHPDTNMPEPKYSPKTPQGLQMAGDVIPFPSSAATIMPETTRVKNMISEQNMRVTGSKPGSNVVKIPNDRYK